MKQENQDALDFEEYQEAVNYLERLNKKAGIRIFIYLIGVILFLIYVKAMFPISLMFLLVFVVYIVYWGKTFRETQIKLQDLKGIYP